MNKKDQVKDEGLLSLTLWALCEWLDKIFQLSDLFIWKTLLVDLFLLIPCLSNSIRHASNNNTKLSYLLYHLIVVTNLTENETFCWISSPFSFVYINFTSVCHHQCHKSRNAVTSVADNQWYLLSDIKLQHMQTTLILQFVSKRLNFFIVVSWLFIQNQNLNHVALFW